MEGTKVRWGEDTYTLNKHGDFKVGKVKISIAPLQFPSPHEKYKAYVYVSGKFTRAIAGNTVQSTVSHARRELLSVFRNLAAALGYDMVE
jgi:hypothetical protein